MTLRWTLWSLASTPRRASCSAADLLLLDEAAHEWLGLACYRLTGRTREFFPAPEI